MFKLCHKNVFQPPNCDYITIGVKMDLREKLGKVRETTLTNSRQHCTRKRARCNT